MKRWADTAGVGYPTPGREGLAGMIDFYVRNGPLIRAIAEAAVTDERIELAYRGSIDRFIEVTTGALERMAGQGLLKVPDPRALARAMTIMNTAYLLAEFGRDPQGDPVRRPGDARAGVAAAGDAAATVTPVSWRACACARRRYP